jgi:hypothetical protein
LRSKPIAELRQIEAQPSLRSPEANATELLRVRIDPVAIDAKHPGDHRRVNQPGRSRRCLARQNRALSARTVLTTEQRHDPLSDPLDIVFVQLHRAPPGRLPSQSTV